MSRVAILLSTTVLLATACASDGGSNGNSNASDNEVQAIKERGTLYVGFVNEAPYDYIDDESNLVGTEIDMIRECAESHDLPEVAGVQNEFDGLLPGLLAKRYDVITAGMAYNEERAEVGAATDPTYTIRLVAFVHKGNPLNIHSLSDIESNSEVRVGAPVGTAQLDTLKASEADSRTTGFVDFTQMWSALQAKRIDAAVVPESTGVTFLNSNPDANANLEIADPFEWPDVFNSVWWVRKSETALLSTLNTCIREMKEDGTMARILEKYGLLETNVLPVDATVTP